MLTEFLENTERVKATKTLKTYRALLVPFDTWLKSKGGDIASVTIDDVEEYLEYRKNWSATTGKIFLATMKSFSKFSLNRLPIAVEPAELRKTLESQQRLNLVKDFKYPRKLASEKTPRERVKALSLDEIRKLFKIAEYADFLPIYLILWFCLRKGELLETTVNDVTYPKIDKRNNTGTFLLKKSSGFRTKTLHFPDKVGELLSEYFSYGKIKCESGLNSRFCRYDSAMGFRVYPHMLRHTSITHFRKTLAPIFPNWEFMVKQIAGHTQEKNMTDLYTDPKLFETDLREAMTTKHWLNAIKI